MKTKGGRIIFRSFNNVALLMTLVFFTLSTCVQDSESEQKNKTNQLTKRDKPIPSPEEAFSYDCSDDVLEPPQTGSSCVEPYSSCPTNYSRSDLDPCQYSNMYNYAYAVVNELNRVSNNCIFPGLPYGCTEIEKCIQELFPPASYLLDHPGTNPWRYCSDCTDCEIEWNCPGSAAGDFIIHIYLDIEDQDNLVDYAWELADELSPTCSNNQDAIPYAVYFKLCVNGNVPLNCFDNSFFCSNYVIKLHVLYKCCSLG